MFIFVLAQNADSRQFTSSVTEFAKLRETLYSHLGKLSAQYDHMMTMPGGPAYIQRLMAGIDQQPAQPLVTGSKPMGPPEDHTSKLPRGLRVEDLKPPPAKRQKVKTGNGAMAAPSPAGSNPAATPRSEGQGQTPSATVESPATMRKNAANTNSKRKREPSASVSMAAKTPREIVAELKVNAGYPTPSSIPQLSGSLPERPRSGVNALGIELDSSTERIREEGFFAAHRALRGIGGVDLSSEGGQGSVWSALSNAMEQFRNVAGPSTINSNTGAGTTGAGITGSGDTGGGDDEIFEQFMDISQMEGGDESWAEPTPELWRVTSRDSEPSPDSIKTVGSTGTVGFGMGNKAEVDEEKAGAGRQDKSDELGQIMLGLSPEGGAYNGLILGAWDEDGLVFGLAAS